MEKQTRIYWKVKVNDRIFFDKYKTEEEAKDMAQRMADSCKFEHVAIVRVKETIIEEQEIERTPLYKMF